MLVLSPSLSISRGARSKAELDQYFFPEYAAYPLLKRYFPHLNHNSVLLDAGCGEGALLKAVPMEITAYGLEIDPAVASRARQNTGREILVGDFTQVDVPFEPTDIISNPPFSSHKTAMAFLQRAKELLPRGGHFGMVGLSSFLSFANTLRPWRDHFSITHELLPRDLYPDIRSPLSFFLFRKDSRRRLFGFALFDDVADIRALPKRFQAVLRSGVPKESPWVTVVRLALRELGGRAKLQHIYAHIEGRQPHEITTWQATVRRTLQEHFQPISRGEWCDPVMC